MHCHVPNTALSIGKPTPNNSIYILDDYLRPVPVGTTGIMWAGGDGVSKGYLGLDDLTSKRFLADPFRGGYVMVFLTNAKYSNFNRKMYNTGDIGRWRDDGSIDHLGRVDDQVKINVSPACTLVMFLGILIMTRDFELSWTASVPRCCLIPK